MNVVQPDNSVIRDLLYAWHKKKSIKCPTCKTCVFQYDGTPDFSSVRVKYEIVLIHHSPCPSSVGNCGKGLFFCLFCFDCVGGLYCVIRFLKANCQGILTDCRKIVSMLLIVHSDSSADCSQQITFRID